MVRHELRAVSSPIVRKNKADLIQKAYKRVHRARALGFNIEAVAILESLITDRLESMIAKSRDSQIQIGNLGPAVNESLKLGHISEDLAIGIKAWSSKRAKVVHEMVKISVVVDATWLERMKFAREVAAEGEAIFAEVSKLAKKIK